MGSGMRHAACGVRVRGARCAVCEAGVREGWEGRRAEGSGGEWDGGGRREEGCEGEVRLRLTLEIGTAGAAWPLRWRSSALLLQMATVSVYTVCITTFR